MPTPQPLPSRLIGALFVERGLVSESQIRVALEIQEESGQQLGQILVERFGVSRRELASVVAEQWAKLGGSAGPEDHASWRRLGDIFVERGFVSQDELDNALTRQRQTGERLGEALVAQGVISKFELAGALAEQMAALEESANEGADAQEAQAEATVHHLPARDPEPDVVFGAMLEQEAEALAGVVEELHPPADAEVLEHPSVVAAAPAPTAEVGHVEPVPDVGEPEPEVVPDVGHAEPEALPDVGHAEPEVVPDPSDLPVEAAGDDGRAEVAAAALLGPGPEPSRFSFDDLPEPEAEPEPPAPVPAPVCLAFAPTTSGYRLVPLGVLPAAGDTIHVPDVGERVVLRVGASPLPLDDTPCVFLEEPVAASAPA